MPIDRHGPLYGWVTLACGPTKSTHRGFQRRVRRLATGQITDAFLGTDLMIEDFEGYEGRIDDYTWKLLETRNVFLPFHYRNELPLADYRVEKDGFQFVDYHGRGGCFPNTTYELREVYVVEATPDEAAHPLAKRVLYAALHHGAV